MYRGSAAGVLVEGGFFSNPPQKPQKGDYIHLELQAQEKRAEESGFFDVGRYFAALLFSVLLSYPPACKTSSANLDDRMYRQLHVLQAIHLIKSPFAHSC